MVYVFLITMNLIIIIYITLQDNQKYYNIVENFCQVIFRKNLDFSGKICYNIKNGLNIRGINAVGSVSHWQCGSQGFESPMLHH